MRELPGGARARFHGLRRLIGNTPLLAVDYTFRGRRRRLFAKSENLNMTGSVKDRMAFHILRMAYQRGTIEPGALIIEATSGNTGIALAFVAAAKGYKLIDRPDHWLVPGLVEAHRVVDVSAEVAGRIENLICREGRPCRQGEKLMTLNTDVLIAGGGPAGSTLATLAAQAGARVLVRSLGREGVTIIGLRLEA